MNYSKVLAFLCQNLHNAFCNIIKFNDWPEGDFRYTTISSHNVLRRKSLYIAFCVITKFHDWPEGDCRYTTISSHNVLRRTSLYIAFCVIIKFHFFLLPALARKSKPQHQGIFVFPLKQAVGGHFASV